MTAFEEFFNKSLLCVVAPEASLGFPNQEDPASWPEWLARLQAENTDRKLAFFDEQLEFLLVLQFEHSSYGGDVDPQKPPAQLLSYLAHLQISYEASYISSIAQGPPSHSAEPGRPPTFPPRSHSIPANARNSLKPSPLAPAHPSIFPPHTPHPIPFTAESDKQYVQAQGVPLRSGVWGEEVLASRSVETFALLWSASSYSWVAVIMLSVQVAFVPTKMSDPLLCLTVSTTLREKPVTVTRARLPLQALLKAAEDSEPAEGLATPDAKSPVDDGFNANGLEEINLLEGLTIDPTFASSSSPLELPSTRLGSTTRRAAFALPTTEIGSPTPITMTPSTSRAGASHSTLRKSFRKTLRTVSGFHVRMRTVFVPFFMLPQNVKSSMRRRLRQSQPDSDGSDDEESPEVLQERELLEAGAEEHTVVLCIEVENGGESPAGFSVESVKVTVSGEGAQTHLIGWGQTGFTQPEQVFPLLLSPNEQYNLLYAVAFMRSPEVDEFSLARGRTPSGASIAQELQRAVTIIISGRPYELGEDISDEDAHDPTKLSYPTWTFPSRWNCVLDLSAQPHESAKRGDVPEQRIALPTPASPFPSSTTTRGPMSRPVSASFALNGLVRGSTSGSGSGYNTPLTTVAGSKRHTLSAMDMDQSSLLSPSDLVRSRVVPSPVNYRTGPSLLIPSNHRDSITQANTLPSRSSTPTLALPGNPTPPNRPSYLPPSISAKAFTPLRTTPSTTYGASSTPPLPAIGVQRTPSYSHVQDDSISGQISLDGLPQTPAYPAFPASSPPSTPHWQTPLASLQSGPVGPSVEIRREKGPNAAGIPPTPGPRVTAAGAFSQSDSLRDVVNSDGPGEPIIVSVGLLSHADGEQAAPGKIHPLDKFTLDIFVFNRSSWTRRFEVSYPDRRRQRRQQLHTDGTIGQKDHLSTAGIIPLENRVRIGPLLSSTCQSVTMDFMALRPGVHSIDSLILTDVQSGFEMTLRSVMDIVVHENQVSADATKAESDR